jgi:hypothetical protein
MKITMKKSISLVTAVAALTLTFGLAYADQTPDMNASKDTGTALYEAFLKHDASIGTGSAAGGVRVEPVIRPHDTGDVIQFMSGTDTGTELYEAYLKNEAETAKGSSAGGVRDKGVDRSGEYTNDWPPDFFREIPTW